MFTTLLLAAGMALAAEPAPAPSSDETELPPLVKMPELLEFVEAPYPEEAQGLEGTVKLAIQIDETGAVTGVEVLKGAGHGFDEAATQAAWKLRFSPAEDETGPVPVVIEFAYGFALDAAEPPPAAVEAPVNLEGVLIEMGTRAPMAGVTVRVTGADGFSAEVPTDEQGRWSFRGVPAGEATLTAVWPSHDPATRTVELTEGELTDVRLWMKGDSYRDDEIVGVYKKKTEDVTRRTITVEEVRRVPGTFGDPVRVIQSLPGAARSPLGSGLLVIRGANPEDSAVYIDGIRIPLIYHLGGYVSVINGDLVDSVDYLPGGYGVEYGRSLGGVVDVQTKRDYPERTHVAWSTDALDSGGLVTGRLGKDGRWGYAAAGRHSYVEYVIPYVTSNPDLVIKPRWYDYQLKLDRIDPDKDDLSLFVFGFKDTLLASSAAGFAQGTDQDSQGDLGTTYATHRAVLRWHHSAGPWDFEFSPSFGRDYGEFKMGRNFTVGEWQDYAEVRAQASWSPGDALDVRAGADLIGGSWRFGAALPINPEAFSDYDPIGEREPWQEDGDGYTIAPDLFLDARVRPLADPDRLLLVPGVRLNYVTADDHQNPEHMLGPMTSLDPRLAARWQVSEGGTLKGGVGIYHQPPQPFEAWHPSHHMDVGFERATSYEVGWEQALSPAVQGDVSLFYKGLDHLIVESSQWGGWEDQMFTNEGIGRAYGAEIILRHARADRFFGWISYTLSRSERNDYPDQTPDPTDPVLPGQPGPDQWYLFELDQTHILVGVAGYTLPHDFEVSGRVQYVTGNPYTPYSGGVYDLDQDFYWPYATGSYDSDRMPPFFALDLRADKLMTFKHWQLDLYLDLLNAVRGENPEFALYNYDYTEQSWIRGLPFIPSPGFEARFEF